MPEEQESQSTGITYFGEFLSWLKLERSAKRSPVRALECFTREFMPEGSAPVANATQDASIFFQALAGELTETTTAMPQFDWMQPISQENSWTNRCMKCFKFQGDRPPPKDPERNSMFRLELPITPGKDETFQSLIDGYFRVKDEQKKEMIQCPTEGCSSRVGKFTEIKLLDPKAAIVVYVNRLNFNRAWGEEWYRLLPPEEQANYYAEMNYRPIKLSNIIKVPLSVGGTALYKLIAAIEHEGASAAGGHFVAHLKAEEDDEWYVANDEKALRHSSAVPEYNPTKAILYMFANISLDSGME